VLEFTYAPATSGVRQLEGPEEVVGLLEVGASGEDLVDEVFDGEDVVLAKSSLDDLIVIEGNALLVDLTVSALVDQFTDGLEVRLAISDIRFNEAEHLEGWLGGLDEDTVVDLQQTEELEDLAGFGGNLIDTLDTHNEDQLGLSRDVV